jgi:hypothetical protein
VQYLGIYAGNENPHATNDIVNIKNRVKASGCNLPFGTVQTLGDFLNNQNVIRIVDQMDWLGYNVYPFFSNLGGQSSQVSLRNQINQIKAKYGGRFGKFRIARRQVGHRLVVIVKRAIRRQWPKPKNMLTFLQACYARVR